MLNNAPRTIITLPLPSLQKALATVHPAVARKSPVPALTGVKIEPKDGEVEFSSTNQELSIRCRRFVDGSQIGKSLLLPALKLESYARLLECNVVSISAVDARRAMLRCGSADTKFALLPANASPYIEPAPAGRVIAFKQDALARMLRFTSFAVSADEGETQLRGALLEIADGRVHVVATDGHRLARYSLPTDASKMRALLPESLLLAMNKTVDAGGGGSCSVAVTDSTIFACFEDKTGCVDLSHRIIAGQFPNYREILPSKAEASICASAEKVVSAIRRCMSIADTKSQVVTVTVTPSELRLSAAEASTGETVDKLDVVSAFQFPMVTAMFRGEYLLDALARISGDVTLSFAYVSKNLGLWINHVTEAEEAFEYVLMGLNPKA
jgi:DNA polymerase III subunit beta